MAERASLFADIAEALRAVADNHGYTVYVSTNSHSIDLTKPTRGKNGSEQDIKVKVRTVPRG